MNAPITVHFFHRVLALVVAGSVIGIALWARRVGVPERARKWLDIAGALVVAQVVLGVLSVTTRLDEVPVSLHTLFAASLLTVLVHVATLAHTAPVEAQARLETVAV